MAKVAEKAWLWPCLPGFTRLHFPRKPGQKPGKPDLASLCKASRVFGRAPDARVAEENLLKIKLNKSAGKCNCQLRVFVLPAYKHACKLYFYKLISFSVLTLPVNVKTFDRKFEGISFLTCESTETGTVTQHVSKS